MCQNTGGPYGPQQNIEHTDCRLRIVRWCFNCKVENDSRLKGTVYSVSTAAGMAETSCSKFTATPIYESHLDIWVGCKRLKT